MPDVPGGADPYGFDALDLDRLRRSTSAKWSRHGTPFAAWVADMDMAPAPAVLDTIRRMADTGVFGYPDWKGTGFGSPAVEVWVERCARRYGWRPDAGEVREFCDVVQAVQAVLHLHTQPGDGVVLHVPSYPPLLDAAEMFGLRLIEVPAHIGPERVEFDYDELDQRLAREGASVLLLCHPQNPTGHRFDRVELERIAELAARHDLLVVADEIHADLTYPPAGHLSFAALGPEVAARTVTIHSASKAFNIAGLRHAVAHVGPERMRQHLAALPNHLLGALNVVAAQATVAAWTEGDDWLDAVLDHLDRNRHMVTGLLAEHLPAVRYRVPDATYLAWLDCRRCGFDDEPFEVFRSRGVQLSPGLDFGRLGAGHVRLNMATSGEILTRMVEAMADPG